MTYQVSRIDRRVAAALAVVLTAGSLAGCFGPAPQSVELTINYAAWTFENPALGLHSARGEYFLVINVTLRNTGDGDAVLSPALFTIYWQNATQGQPAKLCPWTTITVKYATSATATLGINASSLLAPDRVELRIPGRPAVSSPIPIPSAAPSEVVMSGIEGTWADAGFLGAPPSRGDTYLWVNATLRNQWKDQVKLSNAQFWVAHADGGAIAAVGFLGPVSVPPLRAVDVRLAFEVPVGWTPTEFGYDMGLGPWTSALFPAVSDRVAYMKGVLTVSGAAWGYESPAGAHSLPGDYFLKTDVTLINTGLGPITNPVYTLTWEDNTWTTVTDPRVIMANASVATPLSFPVTGLKVPRTLTALIAPGTSLVVAVPPPSPPPVEVEILSLSAVWADANLNGVLPVPGKTFVWVNVTMQNSWKSYLTLSATTFWLGLPDGTAVGGAAIQGPVSVPPLRKAEVRIAFETPFGWLGAQLSYEMGAGPWTRITMSSPQKLITFNAGILSVSAAEWSFVSPLGTHTLPGEFLLNLDIVLRNTAYGTFTGVEYSLQWADNTRTNITDTHVIPPNAILIMRMSFPSMGLKAPQSFSALVAPGIRLMASIPTPTPPPVEVELTNLSSVLADASLDGRPAASGNTFIWVNASLGNHWTKDVFTTVPSFAIEGPNGFKVLAINRTGPDAVGPGGSANLSLSFEVPAGFPPTRLHFAMPGGPWTNASLPAPTATVAYRAATLNFSSAWWSYVSPSGAYAPRGGQFLYVSGTVVNAGRSNMSVSPANFEAVWNSTGVAQPGLANWAPVYLVPGGSVQLVVAFYSNSQFAADSVRFTVFVSPSVFAWKEVPFASAPSPKIQFTSMNATWNTTDLSGVNASGGTRFLRLTFDLWNLWDSSITLSAAYFEVAGTGSAKYGSPQFRGPASVGPGGRATITLAFQVPLNWEPAWLRFDMAMGPWADATIPLPGP